MQLRSIKSWHLLHLYRSQAFLAFIIACSFLHGQTLEQNNSNYFKFRSKQVYFGMSLGGNSTGYKVFRSSEFLPSSDFQSVSSQNGPGFNVHVISNLKIGEYFDFRFLPGFAFSERTLQFDQFDGTRIQDDIESVFVEFPFQIRYKSAPYKDFRIFLLSGIKYSWDVASNSRVETEQDIVRISPSDFQLEVGAGFQIFTPFFIFSPEIKFSQGLENLLIFDDSLSRTRMIERLLSRTVTIAINLEG